MMKRFKQPRFWLLLVAIVASLVFLFYPLPYVLEMPGSAEQASSFITIEGKNEEKAGSFRVMTVTTQAATPILALQSLLPHVDLVEQQRIYGEQPSAEYYKIQAYNMEQAHNAATVVAYQAAGYSVKQHFDGIYVMNVVNTSDFNGKLAVGDVVTSIDQQFFTSVTDFTEYIASRKVGDTIQVAFERDGQAKQVTGTLGENPDTGKAMMGIQLVAHSTVEASPAVQFDPHGISGPSAGLMFTLEIYNQLTNGNLKQGRVIAGTGTMDENGRVGRIGGIDKKVVAAVRAGATIFLAPDDEITDEMKERNPGIQSNYQEAVATAKEMNADIRIYPVKTFQDALKILENQ